MTLFYSLAFWIKTNVSPVCFGARNTQYGTFHIPLSGNVAAVKLVHLYGYVTCNKFNVNHWSFWGCGHGSIDRVNVVVTRSNNQMILPPNQFVQTGKWSIVPGYNSFSPEIILSVFYSPVPLSAQTQLRLWYGEDLVNYTEVDNDGRACADVYVLYV